MKAIAVTLALLIGTCATAQKMNSKTSPEIQAARNCMLHKLAIRATEQEANGKPTLEQRVTILEHKLAYLEGGCKELLDKKR